MTCTLSWIVLVFIPIAYNVQSIFCDENLVIVFSRSDTPQIRAEFQYEKEITDDQIRLFELNNLVWCCLPEINVTENISRKAKVRISLDKNFKIDYSKPAKNVRFVSQKYQNKSPKKIKWTPSNTFTLSTEVSRAHSQETTKAWSVEAGVTFLNVITESGSIKSESKWSNGGTEVNSFQVQIGSTSEIEVDPGETIRSYVSYEERPFVLELTYHMTIISNNIQMPLGNTYRDYFEAKWGSVDQHLAKRGLPNTYSHKVTLQFAAASEITQIIESSTTGRVRRAATNSK